MLKKVATLSVSLLFEEGYAFELHYAISHSTFQCTVKEISVFITYSKVCDVFDVILKA